jgi:hypothetical protein
LNGSPLPSVFIDLHSGGYIADRFHALYRVFITPSIKDPQQPLKPRKNKKRATMQRSYKYVPSSFTCIVLIVDPFIVTAIVSFVP